MPNETTPKSEPWWQFLEDAGYAAGLAGKDVNQSNGWIEAWSSPGLNHPAYIIAGWVAGCAMRRINKETAKS